MKVIDLAEKQHNNEIMPKHIKYNDEDLYFDGVSYYDEEGNDLLDLLAMNSSALTHFYDEVEIIEESKEKEGFVVHNHRFVPNENGVSVFPIEEDKEIEEIKLLDENIAYVFDGIVHCWNLTEEELVKKINELTKSLNELKKGK